MPAHIKDVPVELTDEQLVKLPEDGLDFEAVIGRIEFNLLEQALQKANGNKKIAADILRLKRTTLAAKLKSFGPQLSEDRDSFAIKLPDQLACRALNGLSLCQRPGFYALPQHEAVAA